MVGGLLPAAAVPVNPGLGKSTDECRRHPDMIEPAASVRSYPVTRPVAPPSEQTLVRRHEMPDRINKTARPLKEAKTFDFDRCVADDTEELLVRPDISLQRGNVQVANRNHVPAVLPFAREPCR